MRLARVLRVNDVAFKRIGLRVLMSFCGLRAPHADFVRDELNLSKKIPDINRRIGIVNRIRCLKRGFNSDKFLIYGFGESWDKCGGYLTDYDRTRRLEALGWPFYYIAHDKLVFERFFADKCNVISSSHFLYGGRIYPLKNSEACAIRTVEDLVLSTVHGVDYILKPIKASGGDGIFRLSHLSDGVFLMNGVRKSLAQACQDVSSLNVYSVGERFVQAGLAHEIFPDTLNTIRVVTMFDPRENSAFVPLAVHRFGTKMSAPVDNIGKGGFAVSIDVETGIMGVGYNIRSGVPRTFSTHPDSGITFTGLRIPAWDEIRDTMVRLANYIPQLPMCGWDIVLSGREVYVLELNYNPGLFQFFRPYLTIPKVKEVLEHYHVITFGKRHR